jgi:A/G-specific adenine glycosylase
LNRNAFTSNITEWYKQSKRSLPWRETKDPYLIWLSEIILQQTRVIQGLPYYRQFVEKYPTVFDLARASEKEILRLWQGLGYYSRARNLYKCARVIADDYQGVFPETAKELLTLPGIGKYTAAAVASLFFAESVPVVDGNVYRVLARYFGVDMDIGSAKAFDFFYKLSLKILDRSNPGEYNQAVMEFGALYCTPKNPHCEDCFLRGGCLAFSKSWQNRLPVKKKKQQPRQRYFYYFIIRHNGHILMRQRTGKDIWRGLYEFLLIEQTNPVSDKVLEHAQLEELIKFAANIEIDDKIIRHVLTHQILNVNFAVVNVKSKGNLADNLAAKKLKWYDMKTIETLPKPVLIANYLNTELNSINLP